VTTNAKGLTFEVFNGTLGPVLVGSIAGNAVANLTSHPSFVNNMPSECTNLTAFDTRQFYPDDTHDLYGGRIRGLFIPPLSGRWKFYMSADDGAEIWLNPNGPSASGRTLIAQQAGFIALGFVETPAGQRTSAPIPLSAGQGYYIEGLYKEGIGGDVMQIAAKLEDDPTAPGMLMPLPADWVGGTAAPASVGGTFTITQQPASATVVSGNPVTFSVGTSTGTPLYYQWLRNGADIPGAVCPTYSFVTVQSDNGARFSVRISILAGGTQTSSEAVLTVGADVIRPTLVGVVADSNGTNVTVSFSEPMDPTTSQNSANYLVNNQAVASATRTNATNVLLVTAVPVQPCVNNALRISAVTDLVGNPVNPDPTNVNFTSPALFRTLSVLVPLNATWRYDDSGNDLGTAWSAPGFNDSAWAMGPAPLGFETNAQPSIATTNSVIITTNTAYFRIHFNLAAIPAGATNVGLTEVVDDGAVYYFNGVEAHRTRMPAGIINADTFAVGTTPEAPDGTHAIEGPTVIPTTGLVVGDNVLAVELHPGSATSSDAVFAAQLALISSCRPTLTITQSGNQAVLTWSDAAFSLQRATEVTGPYNTVVGAVSGFSTPITGNSFFRLIQP
jgi:hypothetical protein